MRILFYSPAFLPSVGGLESVVEMVAEGLAILGHQIVVVTTTKNNGREPVGRHYEVVRNPSLLKMLNLTRSCDVFFQHNVSLKGLWPLIFARKPLLIAHHGWYVHAGGMLGWQDRLKLFITHFSTNISVSQAVAQQLPSPSTVIANPYRDDLFKIDNKVSRDKDLVYLGRLVSDKGISVLINALKMLKEVGLAPRLTIVGAGPEEQNLSNMIAAYGLQHNVFMVGSKTGLDLVQILNEHKILVVPSIVKEGFGVVALEAIACGCVVVGSDSGGLPEAIGTCGITFPKGDSKALASCIKDLLTGEDRIKALRKDAENHLKIHSRCCATRAYAETISCLINQKAKSKSLVGFRL